LVEHDRRLLINGTGHYSLTKRYYPAREGGAYVYSSRFCYGSSGFFRSESFTIQKIVSPNETYLGFVRFEEHLRFRLDPALVAKLGDAGTIGIQELAGPINLTFRERALLQSFLGDTAGPGPF